MLLQYCTNSTATDEITALPLPTAPSPALHHCLLLLPIKASDCGEDTQVVISINVNRLEPVVKDERRANVTQVFNEYKIMAFKTLVFSSSLTYLLISTLAAVVLDI